MQTVSTTNPFSAMQLSLFHFSAAETLLYNCKTGSNPFLSTACGVTVASITDLAFQYFIHYKGITSRHFDPA